MIVSDSIYRTIKENSVVGRYVTHQKITKYLEKVGPNFAVEIIGFSVQQRTIQSITLGSGATKVLIWSQMHGNESTTTKSVLDVINYLDSQQPLATSILAKCTIKIIPMLNPDGAEAYTRINANGVDLNRDAQNLSQPESLVLRKTYDDFKPDYCFNLHDQRTMYNVGETRKPATVSFLSPAFNENRDLSVARLKGMALIYGMNEVLQKMIPGQVGRYDDTFNANCVGDTFQMLNTSTILFEAGHYPDDYQREKTRRYICTALLSALEASARMGELVEFSPRLYMEIPQNNKLFFDILVRNVSVIKPELEKSIAIGIRYKEVLEEGAIRFEPELDKVGNLNSHFGHQEFDCADAQSLTELKGQSFWKAVQAIR